MENVKEKCNIFVIFFDVGSWSHGDISYIYLTVGYEPCLTNPECLTNPDFSAYIHIHLYASSTEFPSVNERYNSSCHPHIYSHYSQQFPALGISTAEIRPFNHMFNQLLVIRRITYSKHVTLFGLKGNRFEMRFAGYEIATEFLVLALLWMSSVLMGVLYWRSPRARDMLRVPVQIERCEWLSPFPEAFALSFPFCLILLPSFLMGLTHANASSVLPDGSPAFSIRVLSEGMFGLWDTVRPRSWSGSGAVQLLFWGNPQGFNTIRYWSDLAVNNCENCPRPISPALDSPNTRQLVSSREKNRIRCGHNWYAQHSVHNKNRLSK